MDTTDKGRRHVPFQRGHRLVLPRHTDAPDPVDLKAVRRWVRSVESPTAIDLFCGAGGLSLGLMNAGFEVLVGADSDPFSVETHIANIGGMGYLGDLSDPSEFLGCLDAWHIRRVDLVAGGVPCQPFSRAGRSKIRSLVQSGIRELEDPRTKLWHSFISVVEALQPRVVLLENVPDLAVWDEGSVLMGFRESLRELGYRSTVRIVNAYEHGVAQHRARLFVVGLREGYEFEWPEASSHQPTLWDAIGDLPAVPPGQREEQLPYSRPLTPLQERMRQDVPVEEREYVYDHITRAVRPDDAEAFALLAPGQTYQDIPEHLRRYRSDIFQDKYNRLKYDALCRTITAHIAKDGYWYIHPEQDRTLSIREAARVQTFPDWFRFAGEPTHRYRQIGNAVPPMLAESIGVQLAKTISSRGRGRPTKRVELRYRLMEWHSTHRRVYPWRQTKDPWRVLLAEMCLRRIRSDQVAAVYDELVEMAPAPEMLLANWERVADLLKHLGLRWRSENIRQMATSLVGDHNGQVPDSLDGLRMLPGVGDYVANAVLSFAYERPVVLFDTNTERIAKRVHGMAKTNLWLLRSLLYDMAGSQGPDADFNYALLDFGALVCHVKSPGCLSCPLRDNCLTKGEVISRREDEMMPDMGVECLVPIN